MAAMSGGDTSPLGPCPDCGHDWGRHSMPGAVRRRIDAGEAVEPLNTCPFCDCRCMAIPPGLLELERRLFGSAVGDVRGEHQ